MTSSSFHNADFPPLSPKSSAVDSLTIYNSLPSNSYFSTFTENVFAETLLTCNNFLFPLGTTSTQNPCFSPSTYKSSVASASI